MVKTLTQEEYDKLSTIEAMAYEYNHDTKQWELLSPEDLNEIFWCFREEVDM